MSPARLGIFWLVGEEIVSFSTPLDRAEHAGGFANYRHGTSISGASPSVHDLFLRGVEYALRPRDL